MIKIKVVGMLNQKTYLFLLVVLVALNACSRKHPVDSDEAKRINNAVKAQTLKAGEFPRALLASRFKTLESFKSTVNISYRNTTGDTSQMEVVTLSYMDGKQEITSILAAGLSQDDIAAARDGGLSDQIALVIRSPFAIRNRALFKKVYTLSRWKHDIFGWKDVAFYDLAERMTHNINTGQLAFLHPRDSSDKGYLNTFNHVTAQTFITSIFSEELADFIADVHELHNMPELPSGNFTEDQLRNPNNNPVDNYVDMLNNEIGQEIGKKLKSKYQIDENTKWTAKLLTNYLNDIQSYYSWAFGIGFIPFRTEDEIVQKFSRKISLVLNDPSMVSIR